MSHENIIASGIYYLSVSENIENNYLSFRTLIDEETLYEDNGYPGQEVPLVTGPEKIDTPTGRALVWENTVQHRVGPLTVPLSKEKAPRGYFRTPPSEDDSSAPYVPSTGIRKILCFFLVDPETRIISTKSVPRQQGSIPLEMALEHRQKLMNIRKYEAAAAAEDWDHRVYTFCEH
jgi:hypothetical protein